MSILGRTGGLADAWTRPAAWCYCALCALDVLGVVTLGSIVYFNRQDLQDTSIVICISLLLAFLAALLVLTVIVTVRCCALRCQREVWLEGQGDYDSQ